MLFLWFLIDDFARTDVAELISDYHLEVFWILEELFFMCLVIDFIGDTLAAVQEVALQFMKLAQSEQALIAHDEHPQKNHECDGADDVHRSDEIIDTLDPCGDALFHGYRRLVWFGSFVFIPKCSYASLVATLPRGVRLIKPHWMRYGS
jgi:hypothetical protein